MGNHGSTTQTETATTQSFDDLGKTKTDPVDCRPPEPRPPKKRRREIMLSNERIEEIDKHVLKTPRYAESSIEKLGTYLTGKAENDIEKVRAIYRWVTENISYDTDTYFGNNTRGASNDAQSLLSGRSSVCDGYASIFQLLCEHAGIPTKKITGHSKGYSYKPGTTFTKDTSTNHAWNAVYICNEWRLIDTTWGAGVIGHDKRFKKNFTDFYFLTDPKLFVVDHFPCFDTNGVESTKWQLLKKAKPLEKFNRRIKTSRHAREWGVKFRSHKDESIDMKSKCVIEFLTTHTNLDSVSVIFKDSNGQTVEQCTTISKRNKTYTVTISPQEIGRYTLDIFGSSDSKSSTLEVLVSYSIDCKTVGKANKGSLPKFSGCYGPKAECIERGFENLNKIPVFLTSKTGEVCLPFKVKEDTNVMATLHNSDDVKLVQYTLLERDGKNLRLRARLPKKGYYRLIIYSQYETEKYTPAVSILVYCLKDAKITTPFPQTFPETLKFRSRLLEPMSRDLPPNTDVRFRFSSRVIKEAAVMRETIDKKTGNTWDVTMKTPPSGEVRISGKDNENNSQSWILYKFLVKRP